MTGRETCEKQYEKKSSVKIPRSKNRTTCRTIIKLVFVGSKKCTTHLSVLFSGTLVEHGCIGKGINIPQQRQSECLGFGFSFV